MRSDIGKIPFYYSPIKTPNNPTELPNELDFSLEANEGVICQVKTEKTENALEKAYKKGSVISGQMDDFGLGKEYAIEFLNYIKKNIYKLEGKKVLEIGCGTGYLLSILKSMGASCIGVEPGKSALYGIEKFHLNILHDFFDSKYFTEKFDYIIFYCVLEHMDDIQCFLQNVIGLLNFKGRILLAVPNCEKQILNGDISMLLSEHWNYFTKDSLKLALNRAGLETNISVSEGEGVLFACSHMGRKIISEDKEYIEEQERERANWLLQEFDMQYRVQKEKITHYFRDTFQNGKTIGIYVPGRLVNWLNIIKNELVMEKLRFIDDNKLLYNTYYPGFNCPIVGFEDFIAKPTDKLLIASYTFEDKIREKIKGSGLNCEINSIRELFQ